MAITILSDRIQIGNSYLMESSTGLLFTGEVNASSTYTQPPNAQGTTSGYTSGGYSQPQYKNTIDKFPFATDASATDVGDLTQARRGPAGATSDTHGYTSGGLEATAPNLSNIIDRFPFAANANASDVGDLATAGRYMAGQSSYDSGFTSGLITLSGLGNTRQKFPFATLSNAVTVPGLTGNVGSAAGHSSTSKGYTSGGQNFWIPINPINVIDSFPFASGGTVTDVGDLTVARRGVSGTNSSTHGYTSGGYSQAVFPNTSNVIDRFSFATNANATDVGDLMNPAQYKAGQSSTVSGYATGGSPGEARIDKFPFATNANATEIGFLSDYRYAAAGQQR